MFTSELSQGLNVSLPGKCLEHGLAQSWSGQKCQFFISLCPDVIISLGLIPRSGTTCLKFCYCKTLLLNVCTDLHPAACRVPLPTAWPTPDAGNPRTLCQSNAQRHSIHRFTLPFRIVVKHLFIYFFTICGCVWVRISPWSSLLTFSTLKFLIYFKKNTFWYF